MDSIPDPNQAAGATGGIELSPFLPWSVLFLLLIAWLVGAWLSYARTPKPITWKQKAGLLSLRALAALAIFAALTRPVRVSFHSVEEKGVCYIALDASASMNLRDTVKGRSRWEQAGAILAANQEELAELGARYEVRRYLFDSSPREATRLPGESGTESPLPDGKGTDLAAILELAANQATREGSCAGILILSDGRHNGPRDPTRFALALKTARTPLYAVGLGRESTPDDFQDVAIRLLEAPERGFAGSQLMLRVEIQSQLQRPARVPFTLSINGEKVKELTLSLAAGDQLKRLEIPYVPQVLGMHKVIATVGSVQGEGNLNNNTRGAYFRVYRSRLGVWYAEGSLRKEYGSIRGALENAPNLTLRAFNAFARGRGPMEGLLPRSDAEWREQHLIILGDLPSWNFTSASLERLARFVDEGGALLMVGGVENFGAGSWGETAAAAALPVELSIKDSGFEGPLAVEMGKDGASHRALTFFPQLSGPNVDPAAVAGERAIRVGGLLHRLPALPWINTVKSVKPAASVLLAARPFKGWAVGGTTEFAGMEDRTLPLLVVQDYGKGRSAAMLSDATWQWALKAGEGEAQRAFWRGLVTWLTRSEYREADRAVFADTDRMQYMVGDEALLSTRVQETSALRGRIASAKVTATLSAEGQPPRSWDMGAGPGDFSTRIAPSRPGSYTFKVELTGPSGVLGSDQISFQVDAPDLENEDPRADLKLLRKLTSQSGGFYFNPSEARNAFHELLDRPVGYTKQFREVSECWNHWAVFVLFVAFLSAEWFLRKRYGMA